MAHPQVAAFARLAEGNAKPTRAIAGQNTLFTRTIHDMAYNPIRDEFVVPQFYAGAIMTFRGPADGNEAPIRIIHGPAAQLKLPQRLALDPGNKEIFVPQDKRVLVFSLEAEGNVAPIRILEGPETQLGASALTVDPVHNLLIVSGTMPGSSGPAGDGQILIFGRTAEGNTKPLRVISGPKSQLRYPGGALVTVYPPRGLFLRGVPSSKPSSEESFVGVWSVYDNGDVPPRWMIGGPNGMLRQARGITLDAKNKTVIIADKYVNAVMTYYFPEIF